MMTVYYETLLNIANGIGLAFMIVTIVWQVVTLGSKASQIANVLAAAFLTVVQAGILANNIMNDKSWEISAFFMLLWLFNVLYKALVIKIFMNDDDD